MAQDVSIPICVPNLAISNSPLSHLPPNGIHMYIHMHIYILGKCG